jgi:hypothetical protein
MIQQIRASREQFRYNEARTVKVELSSNSIMYHCRQVDEPSAEELNRGLMLRSNFRKLFKRSFERD